MSMRRVSAVLAVALVCSAAVGADVKFTTRPIVVKRGEGFEISFTVSAPTDVEVAILDAKGRTVRHLAAGLLGPRAGKPFRKDSLSQTVIWDGTDDLGQPAAGGPHKVRVRVGSRPRLERNVGWDGQTIGGGILGMAVGRGGELFVMDSPGWGRTCMRVYDRTGAYLRTIIPYPASTPRERTESVGHLVVEGERIPMIFNGHGGNVMPLTSGMRDATIAVHPKGYLLLASAVGTMAEHGPPRHLLALHPGGGAPAEMGFVGPEIRAPIGFLGGAGEASARYFDHLAVSPDGAWIYFVPSKLADRRPRHAVFRLKWTDKKPGAPFLGKDGRPGNDDAHFNDPQGIAVDAKGNLFVCDRGNGRVMRFSPDGTLLGQFAVETPQQIAVHPGTGEIFVLSRDRDAKRRGRWSTTAALRRFGAWSGGAPSETARLAGRQITHIALDREAVSARLWIAAVTGWSRYEVVPLTIVGGEFKAGAPINRYQGLRFPMFVTADPARGRVLIREMFLGNKGLMSMDIESGAIERLRGPGSKGLVAADLALDRDGNIYTMDGYGKNSLSRYTPEGEPLPFAGTDSHTIDTGVYRGYGPDMGLRGHCVGLNGDIYLIRSSNYGGPGALGARVDVFGPDGKPKKRSLIDGLGYGDCGLGVDAAGNVYVGANIKPVGRPLPAAFMGKASAEPFAWWRRGKREAPWHYMYLNPYLFHWGSVVKFGPEGGAFYGHPFERKTDQPIPDVFFADRAPKGAVTYRSPYLSREIKVVGARWSYQGMGIIPSSSDGPRPDPGCVCLTSRLAVDEYGRVFAPNVFRFSVEMLDTNGNQMARIGRYGNADEGVGGTASKTGPGPEIAFAWPAFVSLAEGKVYVADTGNCRVSVIGFEHDAVAECAVP